MTSPVAQLNFSENSIRTIDMSKLSGFKTITLTRQSITSPLTGITNLHLNTTVTTLNLEANQQFNPANHTSIIQGPWPSQLTFLNFGQFCNISSWYQSFAGFAMNPETAQLRFTLFSLDVPSVSFILRDIITGTTKSAGILSFGILPPTNRGLSYPLSTQDAFTQACYNCLVANTTTACSSLLLSSNALPSNVGRGFSIAFRGIT
jgi:hypothetical protein